MLDLLFDELGARQDLTRTGLMIPCSRCGDERYVKKYLCEAIVLKRAKGSERPCATTGKIYCSPDCRRQEQAELRPALSCANCGIPVRRAPSQVRPTVFCSRTCIDSFGVETVGCSWPKCSETMPARRVVHKKYGLQWKVDLFRSGYPVRWPFCERHRRLALENLPGTQRIQSGRLKWLADPSENLGCRGVTAPATRLLIWDKTNGKCAHCSCELPFKQKPRHWHLDHITPVFKGGLTNYDNLVALCKPCHAVKSFPERAEASRARHEGARTGRGLTHPEKDAIITCLRIEVAVLTERLRELGDDY